MTKYVLVSQREKVIKRAKSLCEYCKSPEKYSMATFEVEHIYPFSRGGKTVLSNLALACSGCNKYKSNRVFTFDLEIGKTVEFYHPRRDKWNEHFAWSEDFTKINGLTAKGRVTIKALKLNRKNLINLRRLLRLNNEFP